MHADALKSLPGILTQFFPQQRFLLIDTKKEYRFPGATNRIVPSQPTYAFRSIIQLPSTI